MGDGDPKRLILARRARFVAAALASAAGLTQGVPACTPSVCLEPAPPADAGDSGAKEAGAKDGGLTTLDDAEPQPCLSTVPPDAESK